MDEDGLGTPALTERDWTTYDHNEVSAEELDAIAAPIADYFLRHTMAELYEVAVRDQPDARPGQLAPRSWSRAASSPARDFFCALGPVAHFPRTFVHVTSPDDAVTATRAERSRPRRGPLRRDVAGAPGSVLERRRPRQ